MNLRTTATALAACIVLSGCAFQKQAIRLQPQLKVETSSIGAGKLTMVNVADERPRSTLGTRGVSGIGEQLTLEGDIAAVVRDAIGEGLRKQGFQTDGPIENQLKVEIRNLDYIVNSGFWAGKLNVEFLLKGICIKGTARPYEQTYRGELHLNIQVVQSAEANTQYVNQVVSDAINKLVTDKAMLQCLAS